MACHSKTGINAIHTAQKIIFMCQLGIKQDSNICRNYMIVIKLWEKLVPVDYPYRCDFFQKSKFEEFCNTVEFRMQHVFLCRAVIDAYTLTKELEQKYRIYQSC